MTSQPRANVYIDGFNLYYGLLRGTPHRWLDLSAFARTLLPAYDIVLVRYFTARLKPLPWDATGHYRQGAYLEALKSLPDVSVHLGEFRSNVVRRPLADTTRIPPDTVAVIDTSCSPGESVVGRSSRVVLTTSCDTSTRPFSRGLNCL